MDVCFKIFLFIYSHVHTLFEPFLLPAPTPSLFSQWMSLKQKQLKTTNSRPGTETQADLCVVSTNGNLII
jgi:hypothetical protein